jgi:hypothetical protein
MAQHLEIKWSLFSIQVPLQKDKIAIEISPILKKRYIWQKEMGACELEVSLIWTTFSNQKDIVQNKNKLGACE